MRVLVFASHPDDEVVGAGGTILRHVESGDDVFLCVVTQTYPPQWSEEVTRRKREEVYRTSRVLGIKEVFFCGFLTLKLNTVPQIELNTAIERVTREVNPHIVYCPPRGDIHREHQMVFEAVLVVCRPQPQGGIRRLLCYELPPSTRYVGPFPENVFLSNYYVDISPLLDRKLEALAQYETELKEFPHPRSLEGVRLLAQERGLSVGFQAAEAFCLVREVLPVKPGEGF